MSDIINELEYNHFEGLLSIDKFNLDEEVVGQPSLFNDVAKRSARANAVAAEAKDRIKEVEAQLASRVRIEAEALNERLTDAGAKARVDAHPERKAVIKAYIDANEAAERWAGLRESFSNRGFMIRDLGQLWMGGYFQRNSIGSTNLPPKQQQAREALNKERQERAAEAPRERIAPRAVVDDDPI
jgi:hypothetical protein